MESQHGAKSASLEPKDNPLNERLVSVINSVDAMLEETAGWEAASWKLATLTDEQVEEAVEPARKMYTRLEAMHIEDLKTAVMDAISRGHRITADALRSAHLVFLLLPRYGRLWKQLDFFLAQSAVYRLLQEWHDTYQKVLRYEREGDDAKFLYEITNLATIMDEAVYVSWEEIPELYLEQTEVMEFKAKQLEGANTASSVSEQQEEIPSGPDFASEMVDKGIPTWLNRVSLGTGVGVHPKHSVPLDPILLPESWNELLTASPTFTSKSANDNSRPRLFIGSDTLESCPEEPEVEEVHESFSNLASPQPDRPLAMPASPASFRSEAVTSEPSVKSASEVAEPVHNYVRSDHRLNIDDRVRLIVEVLGPDIARFQRKSARSTLSGQSPEADLKSEKQVPTQAWYTITKHDGTFKDIYCRIVGSRVMARVGGGWQDLASFLAHWTASHSFTPVRNVLELDAGVHSQNYPSTSLNNADWNPQLRPDGKRRLPTFPSTEADLAARADYTSMSHALHSRNLAELPRQRASSDSMSTRPLAVCKSASPASIPSLPTLSETQRVRHMKSMGQL